MAFQLSDLFGGRFVFLLEGLHLFPGSLRGSVIVPELFPKALVFVRGRRYLLLQLLVLFLGRSQGSVQLLVLVVGRLELVVRSLQSTLVLFHGFLLQFQFLLEGRELAFRAGSGLLEIADPGTGPPEFTLGFRDLRVDGRDIPGEIVAVQGQGHHEIAQDFSHEFHLDLCWNYRGACNSPERRIVVFQRFEARHPVDSIVGCNLPEVRPHLIDERLFRCFFRFLPVQFPRPDFQKTEHVHPVDIVKPPAGLHERVVGGKDIVRQRYGVVSVSAAFVGKSLRTSVVWDCTAMIARAMSCISRSAG